MKDLIFSRPAVATRPPSNAKSSGSHVWSEAKIGSLHKSVKSHNITESNVSENKFTLSALVYSDVRVSSAEIIHEIFAPVN